jgi:glycosyltransferase involved in cell wall biosynthesis
MINDENYGFNLNIYRELNRDLKHLDDNNLFYHWYYNKNNQNRIYSIKSFFIEYPQLKDKIEMNENSIIDWMTKDIYNNNGDKYVGRIEVNNIYEVLIDLNDKNKIPKNKLKSGISLIIRAKNEELNIKDCIESVVDLVDEIIFVDNNSTDNTYELVKDYSLKYDNIKLYKYNINVSRVGNEHSNAIKNKNPNTLGNFYNWSLSKSTYSNVFKWDADFLCIRNNFNSLVNMYKLKKNNDKFAIWFTGITLFENNGIYYFNSNSYYNEYRIFSYKNNFSWYDGDICEYTDPYLNSCSLDKKYRFEFPLFYEIKRTSIDEFQERSSMIDIRDINDNEILNNLKNKKIKNLIHINNNIIYNPLNIYIYTPSLTYGGGNQFIINIYKFYKSIGFNVKIVPLKTENIDYSKFISILHNDIISIDIFNRIISNSNNNAINDYIIFNSDIPFNENELKIIYNKRKIIFGSHSDVA